MKIKRNLKKKIKLKMKFLNNKKNLELELNYYEV